MFQKLKIGVKCIFLLGILFTHFLGNAQNAELFNNATEAYNKGDYNKSIRDYLQIIENGEHSAALYYNLGNSYYRLNQIAPSIYYFEKSLLLNPGDKETINNLNYARNMTIDAIEKMPESSVSKLMVGIIESRSFDQWAYWAVGCMLVFVILYLYYYFSLGTKTKRISFVLSLVFLLVSLIALLMAYLGKERYFADNPAIVFAKELNVKSEPNNRGEVVFVLHEGTKVNVLEELNEYRKIKLADGKTGWVTSTSVKNIKDF